MACAKRSLTGKPLESCSLPDVGAKQCIEVAAGPMVVTDLAVGNSGGSAVFYFFGGATAAAPRWVRTMRLLNSGFTPSFYLSESGLNIGLRADEKLFIYNIGGESMVFWSGFRP